MNHSSFCFRAASKALLCLAWLCCSTSCYAGRLGWHYWSLSWTEIQKYFGHGSKSEQLTYLSHAKKAIAQADELWLDITAIRHENFAQWKQWITLGLDYSSLTDEQVRIADSIIETLINSDAELPSLHIRGENNPDFLGRKTIEQLSTLTPPRIQEMLSWFRFGRSLGQQTPRQRCYSPGYAWECYYAYVLLSPQECFELGSGIQSVLDSNKLSRDDRIHLSGFVRALLSASKQRRAIYVLLTD